MITDRLTISPVVATALREGRPVVALESTLISHGLPYPDNMAVATESEEAVRAAERDPRHDRGARRPAAGRPRSGWAPGACHGRTGQRSQGLASKSRRGPRRRWMGGHDRVGDDDRGARSRDPGVRHGRDRGRPPWRPRVLRRPDGRGRADLRHLVRPRGARPDADGRRLRRAEGDPRRPGDARVPRDPRRPGPRRRSGGSAGVLRPIRRCRGARLGAGHRGRGRDRRRASRARDRWRDPRLRAGPRGRRVGRRRGPRRSRASRRRGRRRRDRRPRADAVAAGTDRRSDRGRVGARQHGR